MKSLGMMTLLMAVVLICPSAFGASLSYAPEANYLTVPAGSEQSLSINFTLNNADSGTYYLWFADSTKGDIPLGWVSASPSVAFVSKWWPTASSTIKIKVPDGTPGGKYSGYVIPRAKKSHVEAAAGEGIYVEINVKAGCDAEPTVQITSFGPDVVWAPNRSTSEVTVSGNIAAPEGCTINRAGYNVDDEYGKYSGTGSLNVGSDGGSFTVTIPVEASRKGTDKDGRHYEITVYAEDEAGIGVSQILEVVVPHDRR